MAYVVPAVLGGLALAVMALWSSYASRKRVKSLRHPSEVSTARVLIHSINDDRCTGCDACVAVCPTNVLDLVENKSRVLHFQDCIQCEACMWACPTTALVMHPEGTNPPLYRMPELDESFQTAVPGQYLIGEVAGKPLVKNAANLGRGVIEHMLSTGLRPVHQPGLVDVAIVGSGPGGLSAALSCVQRGLSYVMLDKENIVASTVARYPKGKLIMAEPYDVPNYSLLPAFDSSKEEMIPIWQELIERVGIKIRLNETVETVARRSDGIFEVKSNGGEYRAQRVVLATGLRGKPRTLGVPGEAQGKVYTLLEDPDDFRGQAVCVVGGGDSALEAAIALADSGAKVVLSYRGRSFARAQLKNKKLAESYEAERRIKIKYQSQVVEFSGDTVTLEMTDGSRKRYPNEAAFVLIGADPPIKWLNKLGIRYVERPHMFELAASASLVERYLGAMLECPPTAQHAAMLVRNEELPDEAKRALSQSGIHIGPEMIVEGDQTPDVSAPRRFLRAATQMFRGGGKLEKPMPLSEFAKAQRRHSGRGRRDQLDAGERTRILRMLRDDGARQADEESKIFFLEDLAKPEGERRSFHEPVAQPSTVGTFEDTNDQTNNGPPPVRAKLPEQPAKPAVIVGLDRANAEGPRVSRSRAPDPLPEIVGLDRANAEGPRVSRSRAPDPLPDLFKLPDMGELGKSGPPSGSQPLSDHGLVTADPDEATQYGDLGAFAPLRPESEKTKLMDSEVAMIHDAMRGEAPAPAPKPGPPPAAPPPAPKPSSQPTGPFSSDFEDEERTMLADFDPQELMRKVAESEAARKKQQTAPPHTPTMIHQPAATPPPTKAARSKPKSVPPPIPKPPAPPKRQAAQGSNRRAKLPPPSQKGRDKGSTAPDNLLFSDHDIDAATAAIDLQRLSTDDGILLDDIDVISEDTGSMQTLDVADLDIEYIAVPPPGPEDQTNTRVESLSDVDWDLE